MCHQQKEKRKCQSTAPSVWQCPQKLTEPNMDFKRIQEHGHKKFKILNTAHVNPTN